LLIFDKLLFSEGALLIGGLHYFVLRIGPYLAHVRVFLVELFLVVLTGVGQIALQDILPEPIKEDLVLTSQEFDAIPLD
jgi:hypothetical protein